MRSYQIKELKTMKIIVYAVDDDITFEHDNVTAFVTEHGTLQINFVDGGYPTKKAEFNHWDYYIIE